MRDLVAALDAALAKLRDPEYVKRAEAERERRNAVAQARNESVAKAADGKMFTVNEGGFTYRGFISEPSVYKNRFRFYLLNGVHKHGPFYTKTLPR